MTILVAQRLKDLRAKAEMTQAEVAKKLHITREAYSMYENNKRQLNYESLCCIADLFHISLDYLFGRSDLREPLPLPLPDETVLLKRYRYLTAEQKELMLEQAELYLHHNFKKTKKSSTSRSSPQKTDKDA